jgi:hypothetical protein
LQISYGNQALILRDWGQLKEAMALLKKQETLCLELGDNDGLQRSWPRVLLAAKTYGKDPLKPAVSVDFYVFEGRSPILTKTVRRCKA